MSRISPEMARQELARRELAKRQSASPAQQKDQPQNLLQKFVRYGVKDPIAGLAEMGHQIINLPNFLSGGYIPKQKDYDYGKLLGVEKPTTTDKLIQGVGQYGSALLAPEADLGPISTALKAVPKAGSLLSKMVGEAVPQAGYSFVQDPENRTSSAIKSGVATTPFTLASQAIGSANPFAKLAARVLAGAGAGYGTQQALEGMGVPWYESALGGIGGALGANKLLNRNAMFEKLTEGVDPDLAAERLNAAKKIGLSYLTPAEAGLSPMAAREQGALSKGEGAPLMYEKGFQRTDSERDAINNVLDTIYNEEKMGPQIKQLYQDAAETKVPEPVMDQFSDNAIVNKAKANIDKKPAYQEALKDVPKDSLGYWDLVKRSINDLEEDAPKNEARILGHTRRALVDHLDNLSPDYRAARRLYERKATREGLEKAFDRKEVNGKNFYRVLASENKFDDLMKHLHEVPEAQDKLKAMRLLFRDVINPPTIATAKGTEERGLFEHRNLGNLFETLFQHVFSGGKHSEDAINFITSPDWYDKMKKLHQIPDRNLKTAALITSLGRAGAQTVPNVN